MILNNHIPLSSYYFNVINKLDKEAIEKKIVDKIPHINNWDKYYFEETVNIFIEYCVIFLSLDYKIVDFENQERLKLVKDIWDTVFSQFKNKMSLSKKIYKEDYDNICKIYLVIKEQASSLASDLDNILGLEMSMANYRMQSSPIAEPKRNPERIYGSDTQQWYKTLVSRDFKLKK